MQTTFVLKELKELKQPAGGLPNFIVTARAASAAVLVRRDC
jgi:hypothetical protein